MNSSLNTDNNFFLTLSFSLDINTTTPKNAKHIILAISKNNILHFTALSNMVSRYFVVNNTGNTGLSKREWIREMDFVKPFIGEAKSRLMN